MLADIAQAATHLAKAEGIDESGWRLVTNVGPDAGQSVFHLHFHLLGRPADAVATRARRGTMANGRPRTAISSTEARDASRAPGQRPGGKGLRPRIDQRQWRPPPRK